MTGLILFIYTLVLLVLFFYSIHSYVLIYLYIKFRKNKDKKEHEPGLMLKEYPDVTIQLPIYNEKFVVRRLLNSILMMDYPKEKLEIQILDDSNDETTEIVQAMVKEGLIKGFDIKHLRRGTRNGFKAGALQYGLNYARGEFIAIFDADFVPPRDFLKKLLPEFQKPDVGVVQARWGHLNAEESFLTRSQAVGLDNHFVNEQELRNQAGFFINFNGTCGIWRKKAIIDAGGWSGDTLAEDLDLSYRVQLKGWRIKYRGDVVVPGELPEDADSFRIQQNRWAKGTFQVGMKLLKDVLKSDLKPLVKYEAIVHLTGHINFLAMLLLGIFSFPIIYFKVEKIVSESYYIFASFFTIGAFGYPILYFLSQKSFYHDYKKRWIYIAGVIAYSMGLTISNTKAIIEAFLNKNIIFTRTPKCGGVKTTRYPTEAKSLIPFLEIILGLYILFTFFYALYNLQFILLPFLGAYGFGFLNLGFSSIKDKFIFLKPQEVLCSRENS
ncbi:MAG: glycosyltransferase [candidate division WOR-3 bacterium]|nr:glycosyltransferase [candidate division WOR-3 bacterium]